MTSYYTFIVLIFFVCYNLDGDCMNNRGFTLIEITCVILLLGILVTFIVPKTTSIIKENKRKTCNSIVTSLEDAANTYTYKNTTLVDNGISSNGYYDISILKLQTEGLVKNKLENPLNGDVFDTSKVVRITMENNSYIYTYLGDDCK